MARGSNRVLRRRSFLSEPYHTEVLEGDIAMIMPPLPIAVCPVPSVALAEMGHLSVGRCPGQKGQKRIRRQVALGIEADERICRRCGGKKRREKLLNPPPVRPLATPLLTGEKSDLPANRWHRLRPATRQDLGNMVIGDILPRIIWGIDVEEIHVTDRFRRLDSIHE